MSDVQVLEITGGRKLFGHHLPQLGPGPGVQWPAQAVSGLRCDSDGWRVTWVISASVTLLPSRILRCIHIIKSKHTYFAFFG